MKLLVELRRRNVLRAAVLYAGAAWALAQGIAQLGPPLGAPEWITRAFVAAALIGFPFWLGFAWFYEWTPQGLKRESEVAPDASIARSTGRTLDKWIIAVLAIAVVLLLTNTFLSRGRGGAESRAGGGALAQHAADAPAARAAPEESIAVLPFVNLSGEAQNEYFSDGITEEILNALAQVPGLKVAARTSAFAFKGKDPDLRKVGEVLGVATVLEGSVQRDGEQVRITAQLIDAHSGYHLWSEKYDRRLTNVFAIEDEIARAIATKLRAQWSTSKPLVRNGTGDMEAHALYLQAIAAIARRGVALTDAAALLEQATTRDPEYAAAWAQLSQVRELMPWYELAPWDSALAEAERTARVALALDDKSAEAHAALASVQRDRFAFADAERSYRRSLELNPGLAEVHNQYAQLLDALGRLDEAMAQERIAIEIDPLAANPQYMLGLMLDSARRHDEATAAFRNAIRISPDYRYSRDQLVFSRIYAGDFAQAQAAAALPIAPSPGRTEEDRESVRALIAALADPARRAQALARVSEVHHLGYVEMDGFARAFWYGLLGDREHGIAELQQWRRTAPQGQLFNALRFLWMPAFDSLRADPRFKTLLAEFGLPDLSVEALRGGGFRSPGA